MALTYKQASWSSTGSTGLTSLSYTLTATNGTLAAGDSCVIGLVFRMDPGGIATAPVGWAQWVYYSPVLVDDTKRVTIAIYHKILDAADLGTTVTWTTNNPIDYGGATMYAVASDVAGGTVDWQYSTALDNATGEGWSYTAHTAMTVTSGAFFVGFSGGQNATTFASPYAVVHNGRSASCTPTTLSANAGSTLRARMNRFVIEFPTDITGTDTTVLTAAGSNTGKTSFTIGPAILMWANEVINTGPPEEHAGSAGVSGSGTLTASGTAGFPEEHSGSAGVSGSGGLMTTGTLASSASSTLSGSGGLTATGTPAPAGSVSLSGSGGLTTAGTPAPSASSALSGSGGLTTTGTPAPSVSSALSGSGTLTVTSTADVAGSAALSGAGALTTSTEASEDHTGSAGFSAAGTLTVLGTPNFSAPVSLSGSGGAATTESPATGASTSLSGSGELAQTASPAVSRSTTLSGTGTLSLAATSGFTGALSLSGTGALTAEAEGTGSASLTGSGHLQVGGIPTTADDVALSASGQLSVDAAPTLAGAVESSATGTLAVTGFMSVTAGVGFTGTGNAETVGDSHISSAALLSGMGLLSISGIAETVTAFGAVGTLSITGVAAYEDLPATDVVVVMQPDRVTGKVEKQSTALSLQGERVSVSLTPRD